MCGLFFSKLGSWSGRSFPRCWRESTRAAWVTLFSGLATCWICLLSSVAFGQANQPQPDVDAPFQLSDFGWRPAFQNDRSTPSQRDSDGRKLHLIVLTNDDFLGQAPVKAAPGVRLVSALKPGVVRHSVWCQRSIANALRRAQEVRPGLSNELVVSYLPAGEPRLLHASRSETTAKRVIVMCCSSDDRLLGLLVGVPSHDDLLALIEDSQEAALIASFADQNSVWPDQALTDRSRQRLPRRWRFLFDQLLTNHAGGKARFTRQDLAEIVTTTHLASLSQTLWPVYLKDCQLRFALELPVDTQRLITVEQHCETRSDWCQTMIPLIAGVDVKQHWTDLTKVIWGVDPYDRNRDIDSLLQWLKAAPDRARFMAIAVPGDAVPGDAVPGDAGGREWFENMPRETHVVTRWREAHQSIDVEDLRMIKPAELAMWIQHDQLPAVDLNLPSRLRYVIVEPGQQRMRLIRQTESPNRLLKLAEKFSSQANPNK